MVARNGLTTQKPAAVPFSHDDDEREWRALRTALIAGNQTLASRVEQSGLKIRYTADHDHLCIYLHLPIRGIGDYLDDDDTAFTFYDEESKLIEGFEVPAFMQTLGELSRQAPVWKTIASYIKAGNSGLFEPPASDLKKLGRGLQALLPAV
jgi:hypothetical protein